MNPLACAIERRRQFEEYLHDGHMTAEEFRRLSLRQFDIIEELKAKLEDAGHTVEHETTSVM